jgi:hypothetical protein
LGQRGECDDHRYEASGGKLANEGSLQDDWDKDFREGGRLPALLIWCSTRDCMDSIHWYFHFQYVS